MKRMMTGISAIAIAAATAVPAFSLTDEVDMLEVATQDALQEYNVEDVNVMDLTVGQIAEIRAVVNSDDPETEKQRRIEAIVEG